MGQLGLLMEHQEQRQPLFGVRQQPRHHRAQDAALLHPVHVAHLQPHPPAQADAQHLLPPLVLQGL
ncbi:hypothetical protein D3C84_1129130 [compost metagenome]